jgi:hypothetical protein
MASAALRILLQLLILFSSKFGLMFIFDVNSARMSAQQCQAMCRLIALTAGVGLIQYHHFFLSAGAAPFACGVHAIDQCWCVGASHLPCVANGSAESCTQLQSSLNARV